MGGNVRAATGASQQATWRKGYDAQIAFRRSQIDRMVQFAESAQCRMAALIQHFGDTEDGLRPCGHCDFCAPLNATAQTFRPPTSEEDRQLRAILNALDNSTAQSRATGRLHTELSTGPLRHTPAADRKIFDTLLDALTRSGLITLNTDQWTNPEGNLVTYKKAALTYEGRTLTGPLPPDLLLKESSDSSSTHKGKSYGKSTGARPSKATLKAERDQTTASYTPAQKSLEANLRDWRKAEAAKTGKPAFMVFPDAALNAIVLARPTTIPVLLQVSGIGPRIADTHGADIIALCRSEALPEIPVLSNFPAATPSRKPAIAQLSIASKEKPSRRERSAMETSSRPARSAVERPLSSFTTPSPLDHAETFTRLRATTTPEPSDSLTPEQQQLDERLREWRKTESERLGLPLFFVLASATLRSIVLAHPQTLTQLKTIPGLGLEKIEKFGPGILEACRT
jgi:ATP-dependent DNA helicase RecQ